MNKVKKTCLSCKKFRLIDVDKGLCRLVKKESVDDYPQMIHTDVCESWIDCGQQYYIRLGWRNKRIESGEV